MRIRGIFDANPERNDRAGISQDCVTDLRLKLIEILVCQGEANAIFAKFGKHIRQIGKYLEEPPLSRALRRRYASAVRFARMVHQSSIPAV